MREQRGLVDGLIRTDPLQPRWTIGGGGLVPVDAEAPGAPLFTLSTRGDGDFRLAGVAFGTLENTATIQSGTMEIWSWRAWTAL